jgi:putative restriction endonuclease
MKGSVGVTDNDWFAFLSQKPGIDEVNFWQQSRTAQFRAVVNWPHRAFSTHHIDRSII